MLRQSVTPEVVVERGQPADLSMVVCADPRPRFVAWEWGSLRLEAGTEMGKCYCKTTPFMRTFYVDDVISWRGLFPLFQEAAINPSLCQ